MKTQTLSAHLKELRVEEGLASIFLDLATVEKKIYDMIDLRDMRKGGDTNISGDVQSSLDMASEKMIAETLDGNEHVCSHLSEECVELRTCKATGSYFVSYDPYDGGTVGDANITVGSIFGIWSQPPQTGETAGKNLICGAYTLWGARLVFAFATKEHGVFWYEHDGTEFYLREPLDFDSAGKHSAIFSPSDIAGLPESSGYEALFRYALSQKLRLRYAGAMVTDTHHMLMRGGMFWYPASKKKPLGHLRLMYECAPLGFMVIAAGGKAVDHTGTSVLDVVITDWHQRTPILLVSPTYAEEATKLFTQIG